MTDVAAPSLVQSAQASGKGPRALAQAVTDAGAALVASDLAAMQAAQAVLQDPASTATAAATALSGLTGAIGDPDRLARAQAMYQRLTTDAARACSVALADLNGMIAEAGS